MRSQCRPRTRPVLCLRLAPHNLSTRRNLTDLYFATQAGNPNWVAPGCPLTARSGGGGILRSLPSLCFSTGPERPWSFQRSRGSRQTHLQPYVPRTSVGESRWWWAPRGSRRGVRAGKGRGPSTRCKPSCRSFRPTLRRREGKLLVCRERSWRPQGHRKCSVNTCHDPHSCYRDCHVIALSRADHLGSHRE